MFQNSPNLPIWDGVGRSTSIDRGRWWSRSSHWKLEGEWRRAKRGVPRTNDLLTDLDGAACDARFRTRVLTHARMHDRRETVIGPRTSSRRMWRGRPRARWFRGGEWIAPRSFHAISVNHPPCLIIMIRPIGWCVQGSASQRSACIRHASLHSP